jgi:hypothetical protein
MVDKLTYKIDGLEADFTDPKQIAVVTYLDEKLNEFRMVANTYRQAIEIIYDGKKK